MMIFLLLLTVASGFQSVSRRLPRIQRLSAVSGVTKVSTNGVDTEKRFDEEGAVVELRYTAYAGPTLLAKGELQYTVGDEAWIPGFDKAVRTMSVGEVAKFECPPASGYGSTGLPPVIGPTDTIVLDIEALDYRGNMFTSATFSDNKPLTPRSASEIRAEYEKRRTIRTSAEATEENLGFIDNLKKQFGSFYFFGFFESATGETPPWYLRPLITFPAIFAAVGLSFYFLITNDVILLKGTGPTITGETPFSLEKLKDDAEAPVSASNQL